MNPNLLLTNVHRYCQVLEPTVALPLAHLLRRREQDRTLHRGAGPVRVTAPRLDVLADDSVNLDQEGFEREVDIRPFEAGCLDEGEVVILGKVLGIVNIDRLQVLEVALVAHEHGHVRRTRVLLHLLEPVVDALERPALGDVVHEQRAGSATVVSCCHGLVVLDARGIPDVRLDCLAIMRDLARPKVDAHRLLAVHVERVLCEAVEQIRLACATVADEDHLEVVVGFDLRKRQSTCQRLHIAACVQGAMALTMTTRPSCAAVGGHFALLILYVFFSNLLLGT